MFCDLLDRLEDALVDLSKVSLKLEDLKRCLGGSALSLSGSRTC